MTAGSHQQQDRTNRLAGIGFMLGGITLFAWHDALNKWLVGGYFVYQVLFLRTLFTTLPLAILVARAGGPAVLRTARRRALLGRGFLLFLAFSCWVGALTLVPLADIVAVSMSMPVATTALGALLLKEHVDRGRWTAVAVGFAGVLLVVGPSGSFPLPATLLTLSSVTFFSLAFVMTRQLGVTERAEAMVAFQALVNGTGSGLVLLMLSHRWITPGWSDLGLFVALGFCAGFAQFLMTSAFRSAPVSVVAPFEYMSLLWAIMLGFIVWGDVPNGWTLAGAATIVGSGLYVMRREALAGRRRRA